MSELNSYVRQAVVSTPGYISGRQEKGSGIIRLNANESPFLPPPSILYALRGMALDMLRVYPDESCITVREKAGEAYGVDPEQIIVDNGSSAILSTIFHTVLELGDEVVTLGPAFALYKTLASIEGASLREVMCWNPADFSIEPIVGLSPKLIVIPNPMAPTGGWIPIGALSELVERADCMVVIDEAYVDFVADNALSLLHKYENLIITRTFSKAQSLAGMRIGLGLSSASFIALLNKVRPTYNIDVVKQCVANIVLENLGDFQNNITHIKKVRDRATIELGQRGFHVLPSSANFLLARVPNLLMSAAEWEESLRNNGVLIRCFPDQAMLADYIRISIGSDDDMSFLFQKIDHVISQR